MNKYIVHCACKKVEISLLGAPEVRAHCHCGDCRELLGIPFYSVTAWEKDKVTINKGEDNLSVFQNPATQMKRYFCKHCGETIFNTNVMDWRVVSQLLIAKSNNNTLPDELASDKHFFYAERVVDIKDDLPKFMKGTSGPMYEE